MEFKSPDLALRAFPVIAASAMQRRLITYGEIDQALGLQFALKWRTPLEVITRWCATKGVPRLNCIVVNGTTGEPGSGVVIDDRYSLSENQWRVFNHRWFEHALPTIEELEREFTAFRDVA